MPLIKVPAQHKVFDLIDEMHGYATKWPLCRAGYFATVVELMCVHPDPEVQKQLQYMYRHLKRVGNLHSWRDDQGVIAQQAVRDLWSLVDGPALAKKQLRVYKTVTAEPEEEEDYYPDDDDDYRPNTFCSRKGRKVSEYECANCELECDD